MRAAGISGLLFWSLVRRVACRVHISDLCICDLSLWGWAGGEREPHGEAVGGAAGRGASAAGPAGGRPAQATCLVPRPAPGRCGPWTVNLWVDRAVCAWLCVLCVWSPGRLCVMSLWDMRMLCRGLYAVVEAADAAAQRS